MRQRARGQLPGEIDASTPVVVLGLGRGVFHHGALAIARSAGRLGVQVHRICVDRWSPAVLSRYRRGWRVISEDSTDEQILEALTATARTLGRPVLVAIDDAGSVFVDEHIDALQEGFLLQRQPHGLARSLSSKRGMYELCVEHGIPTPASLFPSSHAELLEMAEQLAYPVVAKCINAGDAPPGSPRVAIVADREQLLSAYSRMQPSESNNVMLQEYIPGTPQTVWMFNGYFDASSDCKLGVTGQKLRQHPAYTGATSLGVLVENPTVRDTTVRFMKQIGYRGILDIGYRFDERDGQYKLLDVNPRIGATFRLFVAENGLDVLRASYLDLTGQQVPGCTFDEGRKWLVEPLDLISSIIYRRRGDITLGAWGRSFRGVRETAWFAWDDPLPFLALGAGVVASRGARRLRR